MNIWAIADLHLAFGVPDKTMEVFGPQWLGYAEKIEARWREAVHHEDLVLIAGDISWALSTNEASIDLMWIDRLPGTKVLIKGNHDYWWSSLSKLKAILPPSLHLIQNNVFNYQNISIGGTRLWDSEEYNFNSIVAYIKQEEESSRKLLEQRKIFKRELERLELSLKGFNPNADVRIVMTHYPPIGIDLASSQASTLIEKYGAHMCIFGHLHNVEKGRNLFGTARGVTYHLTSADYLDFRPLKIY